MTTPAVKTCVTCKHLKEPTTMFIPLGIQFARCHSPNNGTNAVTGESHILYPDRARSLGSCGREGRNWEAKKVWWKR